MSNAGIAEMYHFIIQDDKLVAVDEHILGTVIAMHKRAAAAPAVIYQSLQEGFSRGLLGSGIAVVGLQTQLFKEAAFGEFGFKLGKVLGRVM